jgi:hypothetical protein
MTATPCGLDVSAEKHSRISGLQIGPGVAVVEKVSLARQRELQTQNYHTFDLNRN